MVDSSNNCNKKLLNELNKTVDLIINYNNYIHNYNSKIIYIF